MTGFAGEAGDCGHLPNPTRASVSDSSLEWVGELPAIARVTRKSRRPSLRAAAGPSRPGRATRGALSALAQTFSVIRGPALNGTSPLCGNLTANAGIGLAITARAVNFAELLGAVQSIFSTGEF